MSQKPTWLNETGEPWRRGESRVVYDNPWIRVTEHQATAPTGHRATYGVVGFKNLALAILPVHEDGSVTLIGQARFPAADYSWELPEGGGPLGVDPLESAKRELQEEAGLEAAHWRPILQAQLSNSVTDERAIGYLATDLSPVASQPDETELLAVAARPLQGSLGRRPGWAYARHADSGDVAARLPYGP